MIQPGDEVGHYRILKPLGEGGMGVVYVAEHRTLGKKVALKVLRPELSAKADSVARFFDEAVAVNRVGHENIVDVTHCDQAPSGEAYFVMELLQGESLAERLKRDGPLPFGRVVHLGLQVASALGAAHAAGIIHRDLKPDNVFLITRAGDRDYVKLLDFGIAKLIGEMPAEGGHERTKTGAVLGTPTYMSPEQCLGKQSLIDQRTDIYSLGIMFFHLLTGDVPFHGEGFGETMMMHVTSPFPSVRVVRPEVPEAFERLLLGCVAKSPAERVPSMEVLAQYLWGLREPSLAGPVRAVPTPSGLAPVNAPAVAAAVPAAAVAPPGSRGALIGAFVAVSLMLAAGVTALVLRDPGRAPTAAPVEVARPAAPLAAAPPVPVPVISVRTAPPSPPAAPRAARPVPAPPAAVSKAPPPAAPPTAPPTAAVEAAPAAQAAPVAPPPAPVMAPPPEVMAPPAPRPVAPQVRPRPSTQRRRPLPRPAEAAPVPDAPPAPPAGKPRRFDKDEVLSL